MELYQWALLDNLPSILFMLAFWGAVLSGVVLIFIGFYRKNPDYLALSAVLVSPLCFYLMGANNWMRWVGFLVPVFLVGVAVVMVRRGALSKQV
ncbi:MAG: hypothetical protein HRT35_24285 [Algicola sp.]|nr:hypothetical protein [Algicola sp.]